LQYLTWYLSIEIFHTVFPQVFAYNTTSTVTITITHPEVDIIFCIKSLKKLPTNAKVHWSVCLIKFVSILNEWNMEHIELVNVQQAKSIYVYKCTKGKIKLKRKRPSGSIKMCRIITLARRYINIVVKGNNQRSIKAKRITSPYRINQNQSAFVGLSIHFILPINPQNVGHTKFIGFCVFAKYSPPH
jgi:hypothetical protein